MQSKRIIPFLTIIFHLLFFPFSSIAGTYQENSLTKAIQLFDKEKYDEAELLFKELLKVRPDDFMVNYFYGACRTENGHYSEKDLSYLIKASKEVNPLNIDYYFAVQYHAENQWEKALVYYKLYKTVSSENEQEKVELAMKMEQCTNEVNPFISSDTTENKEESDVSEITAVAVATGVSGNSSQTKENFSVTNVVVVDSTNSEVAEFSDVEDEEEFITEVDSTKQDTILAPQVDEIEMVESVNTVPKEEQITFSVNSEITYLTISNFRTEEGESYFKEGNKKQLELDRVIEETEILRENYGVSKSRAEKDSIGQQILALEGQTYELNSAVKQLFIQAKNAENSYWQNASEEDKENFIEELNAISLKSDPKSTIEDEVLTKSPDLIIPPMLMEDEPTSNSVPEENNSGITYKIQLGAYSRGIANSMKPVFSKISILRKVENYTDENGVVVYTTGNLTNYDDAVVMQKQVKQEGIKDCKIAAYLNGKRITLEQAKELDKNR